MCQMIHTIWRKRDTIWLCLRKACSRSVCEVCEVLDLCVVSADDVSKGK